MSATATAGLKAPPKFVTNEWAWSYTLGKLAGKGKLTEDGNPQNYAAAVAIYKNVVAKYEGFAGLHEAVEVTRAELLGLDRAQWVVAHGSAWAATEDVTARLYFQVGRWWLERIDDDETQTVAATEPETVTWLLRGIAGAEFWINAQG